MTEPESTVDLARAIQERGWRNYGSGGAEAVRLASLVVEESERTEALEAGLLAARTELAKWRWGDHHYGDFPQEQRVVDAVAAIDALLAATIDQPETP